MAFQPGNKLAKGGRKDKPWADALRVAATREDEDGKKLLAKIAEQCVAAAQSGDIQAIKEIGDRLDGKAHQTVDATLEYSDPENMSDGEILSRLTELDARRRSRVPASGQTKPSSVDTSKLN